MQRGNLGLWERAGVPQQAGLQSFTPDLRLMCFCFTYHAPLSDLIESVTNTFENDDSRTDHLFSADCLSYCLPPSIVHTTQLQFFACLCLLFLFSSSSNLESSFHFPYLPTMYQPRGEPPSKAQFRGSFLSNSHLSLQLFSFSHQNVEQSARLLLCPWQICVG